MVLMQCPLPTSPYHPSRWISELEIEQLESKCLAKFKEALRSQTVMSFFKKMTRLQISGEKIESARYVKPDIDLLTMR
ncbi:hypothetical protein KIN20_002734 [Parelaphostrongylus tenuis]|uniref:Uncharacterized protein n=1 Tax=Parelaphostrongylus tenuis TaxID=148309 RepID=A0AAD5M088_PARTN|nr:hypothetical protein KIN20_002734 [Parelaphostrongylus tenuis]